MSFKLTDTGKKATLPKGRTVSVGIHQAEGSEPHKGTAGQSVVEIAGYHEFGLGVPRRSFIADWFDQSYNENHQALHKICAPAVTKPEYLDQALTRFAAWAVGQVQSRIAVGIPPELVESTKKQKARHGSGHKDTPLIDTGQLRSSIRGRVT